MLLLGSCSDQLFLCPTRQTRDAQDARDSWDPCHTFCG
ncbi:hypothetical protein CYB_1131 [Synechococcus sp. JA-2-3B'a(2-13)]|nr:hypothetical protein CYB_1131 [Synechococcus sp. JA-2-3B'a(2-13)]